MKPYTLFFPLILVLALASPLVHAQTGQRVPLEWSDSGRVLKPGYKIRVYLTAEGDAILGLADAAVRLGDTVIIVGLRGESDWTWTGRKLVVYLDIADESFKLDETVTKKLYDIVVEISMSCPDDSNLSTVTVKVVDLGIERTFRLRPRSLILYMFTEESLYLHSEVDFGTPEQIGTCGSSYPGDVPGPGTGQHGDPDKDTTSIPGWLAPLKDLRFAAGLGLVMVALGLFIGFARR